MLLIKSINHRLLKKSDKIKEKYYHKIWTRFAWLPTKMDNGSWIWLEHYYRISGAKEDYFDQLYKRLRFKDVICTIKDFVDCGREYKNYEFVNGKKHD